MGKSITANYQALWDKLNSIHITWDISHGTTQTTSFHMNIFGYQNGDLWILLVNSCNEERSTIFLPSDRKCACIVHKQIVLKSFLLKIQHPKVQNPAIYKDYEMFNCVKELHLWCFSYILHQHQNLLQNISLHEEIHPEIMIKQTAVSNFLSLTFIWHK